MSRKRGSGRAHGGRGYHDRLERHAEYLVRHDREGRRHTVLLMNTARTILSFQRRGQKCFMAQTTLAHMLGYGDKDKKWGARTVRRHLSVLERLGLLTVDRSDPVNRGDGTFTRATNVYKLHFCKNPNATGAAKAQVTPEGQQRPQQSRSSGTKLLPELPATPAEHGPAVDNAVRPPPYGRDPSSRASFLASCRDAHPDRVLLPPPIRPNGPAVPC